MFYPGVEARATVARRAPIRLRARWVMPCLQGHPAVTGRERERGRGRGCVRMRYREKEKERYI